MMNAVLSVLFAAFSRFGRPCHRRPHPKPRQVWDQRLCRFRLVDPTDRGDPLARAAALIAMMDDGKSLSKNRETDVRIVNGTTFGPFSSAIGEGKYAVSEDE